MFFFRNVAKRHESLLTKIENKFIQVVSQDIPRLFPVLVGVMFENSLKSIHSFFRNVANRDDNIIWSFVGGKERYCSEPHGCEVSPAGYTRRLYFSGCDILSSTCSRWNNSRYGKIFWQSFDSSVYHWNVWCQKTTDHWCRANIYRRVHINWWGYVWMCVYKLVLPQPWPETNYQFLFYGEIHFK